MSLGSALLARLRRGLGPAGGQWVNRLLYEAIYSLPAVEGLGFFNGGFAPVPPDMPRAPALLGAPYQAALYDLALRRLPGEALPPGRLLDIGCGIGGGLLQAAATFPTARLAGADQSRLAIARARRRLTTAGIAAELRVAGAHRLPFRDAAFDRIVSIGTLTYVGLDAFMAEAARLLAPGGLLSVTGGVGDTPLLLLQARFAKAARATTLSLQRFEDITAGCLAALEAQAGANAALVGRLPRPLRRAASEWAVLPGSRLHGGYLSGTRKEFAAVFRRDT